MPKNSQNGQAKQPQQGLALFIPGLKEDQEVKAGQRILLPLSRLHPDPKNPRRVYEDEYIKTLGQRAKDGKILEPIEVRRREDGDWQIIDGHCRYYGYLDAGLEVAPCTDLSFLSEEEALEAQADKNRLRRNLRPYEEALQLQRLLEIKGWTQQSVAEFYNCSLGMVQSRLRLLRVPEAIGLRVGVDLIQEQAELFLAFEDHPDLMELAVQALPEGRCETWPLQCAIMEKLTSAGVAVDPFDWNLMEGIGRRRAEYEERVAKLPQVSIGRDRAQCVLVLDPEALAVIVEEETTKAAEDEQRRRSENPDADPQRKEREEQAVQRELRALQLELVGKGIKSMIAVGKREELFLLAQALDYRPRTKFERAWLAEVSGLAPDVVEALVGQGPAPSKMLMKQFEAEDDLPLKRLVSAISVLRAGGWDHVLRGDECKAWTGRTEAQLRAAAVRRRESKRNRRGARPKKGKAAGTATKTTNQAKAGGDSKKQAPRPKKSKAAGEAATAPKQTKSGASGKKPAQQPKTEQAARA